MLIRVAARDSKLSRAQVDEVLELIQKYHPSIRFEPVWIKTSGDIDQNTSLRTMEKTDFFTKEVDEQVLHGHVRIAIHSAKDLPGSLPIGLQIAAVTEGVDSRDCLVMREKDRIETLPKYSKIATSSLRREEIVKNIRHDLSFIDLRGTIEERLSLLRKQKADGVVVAYAALIRLKLTHLNFQFLPGPTVEGQGKLAIICRESDREMMELLSSCVCSI